MPVCIAACVIVLAAGCAAPGLRNADCAVATRTFWFAPGLTLVDGAAPAAGSEPGNGFASAFLTNDIDVWQSAPLPSGLRIVGNLTIEFWARNQGTPAPIVVGGGPGEGYHFFNQVGSDASFAPATAVSYNDAAPMPGSVDHYVQTFPMPPGGFVIEQGNRLRVLLTSLVLDAPAAAGAGGGGTVPAGATAGGHEILFGGDTPSAVRFTADCFPASTWAGLDRSATDVELAGNRGLFTGAVPATEGRNTVLVPFSLQSGTQRLTVTLQQRGDLNPVKDDLDMDLLDGSGAVAWAGGSPFSDEVIQLHRPNLEALPAGPYAIRVNSYSGAAYAGTLTIVQEA